MTIAPVLQFPKAKLERGAIEDGILSWIGKIQAQLTHERRLTSDEIRIIVDKVMAAYRRWEPQGSATISLPQWIVEPEQIRQIAALLDEQRDAHYGRIVVLALVERMEHELILLRPGLQFTPSLTS